MSYFGGSVEKQNVFLSIWRRIKPVWGIRLEAGLSHMKAAHLTVFSPHAGKCNGTEFKIMN